MGISAPAKLEPLTILNDLLLDKSDPVREGTKAFDAQLDDVVAREEGVEFVMVDLQPIGYVDRDRAVQSGVVDL